MAPTLYQIEESYRDRVNFVMVNADNLEENWPLIEALGVDAIPHLALLEADGTVDTALIGPVPKEWLTSDLDVLIENAQMKPKSFVSASYKPLPYQMLDVFANKSPEQRRIHVEQQPQQQQQLDQDQPSDAAAATTTTVAIGTASSDDTGDGGIVR
jgi:thioredoxin-like negative regulator of GroEL